MTGDPLLDTDEVREERLAEAPFWKTRTWWARAGRTAIAVYLSTALAFLARVVVARGLGPQEFGTVVLAVAVVTLVMTLLNLTLEEAVVHHGYRALAQDDTGGLLGLLRASLVLDIAAGLAVSAGVIVFAAPLADLVSGGEVDPGLVRLAALVPLVSPADATMSAVLQLAGRPDLRGWVMAGTSDRRMAARAEPLARAGGFARTSRTGQGACPVRVPLEHNHERRRCGRITDTAAPRPAERPDGGGSVPSRDASGLHRRQRERADPHGLVS